MDLDSDWEDDEWDESDDSDLEPSYLPCPNCGEDVYEDLEQCPYCGDFITFSTNPWSGKSPLWVVLGALGVLATLFMLLLA